MQNRIMKNKGIPQGGLVYKRSRISYIENYIIIALAVVVLAMLWSAWGIEFSLSPKTQKQFVSTMAVFAFMIIAVFLFEEPSIESFMRKYVVTNHEIVRIEGILTKKKTTIPYQSVANIKIHKSVLGRLLNYGTLHITCVGQAGNDIVMKGIRNPDEVYNIIQNKISLMRKSIVHKKRVKRESLGKLSEEEREEAKELERQFEE